MLGEWLREVEPAFKGLLVSVVTILGALLMSVSFSSRPGSGGGLGEQAALLAQAGLRLREDRRSSSLEQECSSQVRGGRRPPPKSV